ncbi:MAG: twin transmembrane helix small protein [Legionella sp.]|nr:twin transmembrane helix small protein [Legionella sp.]
MFTRVIILIVMLVILIALGSGLVFLVRDTDSTQRTVKALTWRIALSLALFLFLFLSFRLGWITPHALT